ncbi:crossover junction endodeoxyribonuclease RuvC [Paenibacillus daejeonensis]|uniref:crossover junction endodeoxyribonuclease RuvC n=1 Tax=Paenibacillus daejeonensis TaxID=135193 RepID=UPI00036948F7|nr:crossover junction endodeoxyribonuclease RuvC [Paenibacillus daejeonensis]
MKLLGIDHGTNHAGWATMQNGRLTGYGLRNYTKIEMPIVLDAIYQDSYRMIKQESPDFVVLERPVHFRNSGIVIALVGAYSMVTLAALHLDVKVESIRPTELKMQTGKGNADKETVALEMAMTYDIDIDSIAIPVHYTKSCPKGKYKVGDIKDHLFDPADAIALCSAFHKKQSGA